MKNFLHKRRCLVITLVVIIIIAAGISILFSVNFQAKIIDYRLSSDDGGSIILCKPEQFYSRGTKDFLMSKDTIEEILEYPDRYSSYLIRVDIKNKSVKTIYDFRASLLGKYDNLWLDETSLWEWPLDLTAGEEISAYVYIIVRTHNMTEAEIDRLIKSIGIKISASNFKSLSSYNSREIYFEE